MDAGMETPPLSPALESLLGGKSQAQCAEALAKHVNSSSAGAAKLVVQELLDHPHNFYKVLGMQGATQLSWQDALLAQFQSPSTRVWKRAVRSSIHLARSDAEATAVVKAGLDLKVPAAQHYFYKLVRSSKNQAVGQKLAAAMADSSHALSQRYTAAQLLHLLPVEAARKAVSQDTGLPYQLSWRKLARQQPELALEFMRQALETAKMEETALSKRWDLVLPAARELLNKNRSTSVLPILDLLTEFSVSNQILPKALLPLANLLVPSGDDPATLERFWAFLHRPGAHNALHEYNMASLLKNRRCAKALIKKEGVLEGLAALKLPSAVHFIAFLHSIGSHAQRAALFEHAVGNQGKPLYVSNASSSQLFEVLPPRLRNSLVKEAAETRAVQNNPRLMRELLKYRFLPDVRKDIETICRAANAGDRGVGIQILLRAAILSRVDLTEVLDYVSKRIQNEQAPVVHEAFIAILEIPPGMLCQQHVPILKKLCADAVSAEGSISRYQTATLMTSLMNWRLSFAKSSEDDELLQLALDSIFKPLMKQAKTKEDNHVVHLGLDTRMTRLSQDQARLALAALLQRLERIWASNAQAAASATIGVARSFGRRAWENHRLQDLIEQAVFLEGEADCSDLYDDGVLPVWLGNPAMRLQRAKDLTLTPERLTERYGVDLQKTRASLLMPDMEDDICVSPLMDVLTNSSEDLTALLERCDASDCIPNFGDTQPRASWRNRYVRQALSIVPKLRGWTPAQQARLAKLCTKKWASFCSKNTQGLADDQSLDGSWCDEIPYLVPIILARLDGGEPEHFDSLLKTVPKEIKLACQISVLRSIPRLDNMTGTLTQLSQWAAEDLMPVEAPYSRGRGPTLGGALSRCANYTAPDEIVATFQQMLADPRQKLTIRKQILRTIVRLPGPQTSALLEQSLANFPALHRDLRIAVLQGLCQDSMSRRGKLLWRVAEGCAGSRNEDVAQALIKGLKHFLLPNCEPQHSDRYFKILLHLAQHCSGDTQAQLWNSLRRDLEPRFIEAAAQEARKIIVDVNQGCASEGWKAAAELIVEGGRNCTGASTFQTIITEMAAGIEGEEQAIAELRTDPGLPLCERLLYTCQALSKAGGMSCEDWRRQAAAQTLRTLDMHCPQFVHQHFLLASLGVMELPWNQLAPVSAEIFRSHLAGLAACCTDQEEVLSVAFAARAQVNTYIWQGERQQAVHTLITSLATSSSAADRRIGVGMLLAQGAKEAWKEPDHKATQVAESGLEVREGVLKGLSSLGALLLELRRDEDSAVRRAAYQEISSAGNPSLNAFYNSGAWQSAYGSYSRGRGGRRGQRRGSYTGSRYSSGSSQYNY